MHPRTFFLFYLRNSIFCFTFAAVREGKRQRRGATSQRIGQSSPGLVTRVAPYFKAPALFLSNLNHDCDK